MLDENTLSLILREPIGVVGQIVPWNFPFLMAAWKLAPVLAAGCCTVFKPSSYTSLSVLELAKLIDGILPPGVFNIVTGRGSKSGQYMLEHPGFRKLAYRPRWSWAANRLIFSSRTVNGIWRWTDCSWESCSTRGRYAVPDPVYLCMKTFMTDSWKRLWKSLTA